MPATIDTDERRAVVRRLTDALYEYLTLDVTEMERHATMRTEAQKPRTEDLVRLQESVEETRAKLAAAREKLESTLETVPEAMESTIRLQLTMLTIEPLEQQLEYQEGHLSDCQRQLESAESAASDSVQS